MIHVIIGFFLIYGLYRSNMPPEVIIATAILTSAAGIIDRLDDIKIMIGKEDKRGICHDNCTNCGKHHENE